MLELIDVSKKVGAQTHIHSVSISLERGTLNVLLGPTLSGKTTLMRLMAGLDKPTSGDIHFDGHSVKGVSVRKRNVAMVYQQFINYPGLTVYENIASPLRLAKESRTNIDRQVREAAELLKLTEFLERTPLNLSGGQQQRTALARALVKKADLVLLDEPLANLDYKLREELRAELPRLFAETGAVFVYATTEPQEALLLGGKTATLHEGQVTQFDHTIDVYSTPKNLITAQTFADPPLNLAPVMVRNNVVQSGEQTICTLNAMANSAVQDGHYNLAIKAHHIALEKSATHSVAINAIVGTSEITGSETFIHVDALSQKWVVLTSGVHRLDAGAHITVFADPNKFYLFNEQQQLVHSPVLPTRAA